MDNSAIFQKSIKPRVVEESIDFYFHRRLAAPIVRLLAKTPLSPNQVTVLSCITGLLSAFSFYQNSFVPGSWLLLAAVVLDCSDGMLARLTGRSGPFGRILDGLLDAVWISAIWVGIYNSGRFSLSGEDLLKLMIPASISMILHCWTYEGVKGTYLTLTEGKNPEQKIDSAETSRRLRESLRQRRYFGALLYFINLVHHAVFGRGSEEVRPPGPERLPAIQERLFLPMRLWSFLGEGTHLGIMFAAGLLTPLYPDAMLIAFGVIAGPLNLVWIPAAVLWFRRKKPFLNPPGCPPPPRKVR